MNVYYRGVLESFVKFKVIPMPSTVNIEVMEGQEVRFEKPNIVFWAWSIYDKYFFDF
jgi:hypothetical protein